MAKIVKRILSGLTAIDSFFTQLSTECPFISTSDPNDMFCIGDQIHVRHKAQPSYGSETEMYDNNNTLLGSMINAGGNGGHYQERYTVVYDDNICLVVSDSQIPYSYNYGYIVILYEKIGAQEFYGVAYKRQNAGIIFQSIENYVVKDVTSLIPYNHSKQISLSTQQDQIIYTNSYLTTSGMMIQEDPNFISCSDVVGNMVITFDGNNYYSIGTNTLVPLDSN